MRAANSIAFILATLMPCAGAATAINDADDGGLLRYSPGWTLWTGKQPRGGAFSTHYEWYECRQAQFFARLARRT